MTRSADTGGIINNSQGKAIINGGDPLPGCPIDWDWARKWQETANEGFIEEGPKWSWDCGFKLDFDGPIISVSSRFYPPKSHYGSSWDGNVSFFLMGKLIEKKSFDCESLEELKKEVEFYVSLIASRITLTP